MSETKTILTPERKAAERFAARLLGLAAVLILAVTLLPMAWDKLSPFIIAIPIAAALQPLIRWMTKKLKLKRSAASLILVLLVLVIVLGLMSWVLAFGISQVSELVSNSPTIIGDLVAAIKEGTGNLLNSVSTITPAAEQWIRNGMNELGTRMMNLSAELAGRAVTISVSVMTGLPYFLIYITFLTMGLYFISKDYDEIRSWLPGGKRRRQDSDATRLTNSAVQSLIGYLKVQGTFGVMVLVFSLVFMNIFKFPYAVALAFLAGGMELIPMIGSGFLYFVLAAVFFIGGNPTWGIEAIALTLGLQLLRRVLEPRLMSNRIGITPLESLIGMFVGMRFGGILGLIGGPVLMAVLVGALHGNFMTGLREDGKTLAAWFRKRWAKDGGQKAPGGPDGGAGENAAPAATPENAEPAPKEPAPGKRKAPRFSVKS